jgi:heme/copper-type cytochrome/quinol oxidase subunit 2
MNQPLADAIFWLAAIACVIAEIAILRSTYRAQRVEKSSLVPAARQSGEIVWAIIPALGLSVLLVFTWQKVQKRDAQPDNMPPGMMMDHQGSDHTMQQSPPAKTRHL